MQNEQAHREAGLLIQSPAIIAKFRSGMGYGSRFLLRPDDESGSMLLVPTNPLDGGDDAAG